MKKEAAKTEYISNEKIKEQLKMHTYINNRGEVYKTDTKYFIKD